MFVDNITIKYAQLERQFAWIPCKLYLPFPFDIVLVRTVCQKTVSAWYNGRCWDGYKLGKLQVVSWRRIYLDKVENERQKKDRKSYARVPTRGADDWQE